jgi:hypothetical protein
MINHKIILELKTSEFNPYWPISIHIKSSANTSVCISIASALRLQWKIPQIFSGLATEVSIPRVGQQ